MGIVAFNWTEEGNNQLMLLMNRDNWESRVIRATAWDDTEQIVCGRCEENSGTWLGISKSGRVSFLVGSAITFDQIGHQGSSEMYPVRFLNENSSPMQFAEHLAQDEDLEQWHTYSLIVADLNMQSMVHIRKPLAHETKLIIETVPFGVHTLSRRGLDSTEFLRVTRLRDLFNDLVLEFGDHDQLPPLDQIAGMFMYDSEGTNALCLDTNEYHLLLGRQERYGTTSTTALVVKRTREVMFFERFRDINGEWDCIEHNFNLNIQ
ncbi:hypothetical protein CARUB_v10024691mg [Capsella rubella]|uniref:Uncharacterized protein n=1 Tax=Capsella rubella TaxID=81985 RepID=R0G050_9BRAS|nr:uncharacterized protein LOC17889440 [Capsella rubella]EOA28481.1 hypothetical protein CARUB_v10024691mg [Capsella rubella]